MSSRLIGWAFVAIQAVLLGVLILLPRRNDWPTPTTVALAGQALVVIGLLLAAVAALRLGRSLTPTPVPVGHGQLQTGGLYRFVRHPIYTGVLTIVAGLTIGSGSWLGAAVGIVTVGFFNAKAAWEEARLAERYPGYAAYAAVTPRFLPRLARTN